ncbi:hypothetical protein [Emticicia sp. C21]|uniref:hypothetical protein n=1 Tax=Emticicia sp. C21 TaxID=2302915 RepID=UPI000E81D911|nr:hypothetical protein [Emticicia sp. C21]RFS14677.1 hypothetical protein D0T08_20825 [Emticicia sp. C21]
MRLFLTFLYFPLWSLTPLYSQTKEQYQHDLSALHTLLKKTPSYKDQITGVSLEKYTTLYESLMKDTTSLTSYHYFINLAKLVMPIHDGHLSSAQMRDFANFKDRVSIEKYVASQEFKDFPSYSINIDSLKTVLKEKSADSVEGIYYYDKYYQIGIVRITPNEYIGVIVDKHEEMNLWEKGQIALHLYEYEPHYFKAVYAHPLTKNFILYNNERLENQSFINSYFYLSYTETIYRKNLPVIDYTNLPKEAPMFQLKNLTKNTQYLLIKNFSANSFIVKQSNAFMIASEPD